MGDHLLPAGDNGAVVLATEGKHKGSWSRALDRPYHPPIVPRHAAEETKDGWREWLRNYTKGFHGNE